MKGDVRRRADHHAVDTPRGIAGESDTHIEPFDLSRKDQRVCVVNGAQRQSLNGATERRQRPDDEPAVLDGNVCLAADHLPRP